MPALQSPSRVPPSRLRLARAPALANLQYPRRRRVPRERPARNETRSAQVFRRHASNANESITVAIRIKDYSEPLAGPPKWPRPANWPPSLLAESDALRI